jgi:hypothetical protein
MAQALQRNHDRSKVILVISWRKANQTNSLIKPRTISTKNRVNEQGRASLEELREPVSSSAQRARCRSAVPDLRDGQGCRWLWGQAPESHDGSAACPPSVHGLTSRRQRFWGYGCANYRPKMMACSAAIWIGAGATPLLDDRLPGSMGWGQDSGAQRSGPFQLAFPADARTPLRVVNGYALVSRAAAHSS